MRYYVKFRKSYKGMPSSFDSVGVRAFDAKDNAEARQYSLVVLLFLRKDLMKSLRSNNSPVHGNVHIESLTCVHSVGNVFYPEKIDFPSGVIISKSFAALRKGYTTLFPQRFMWGIIGYLLFEQKEDKDGGYKKSLRD